MSCYHLMCLEEAEKEQADDTSGDANIEDPFLDLVGDGFGFFDVPIGLSFIDAANVGHLKCVQTLLEAGADVNTVDIIGNTAISESAAFDRVECLKLLVKAGADVNVRNIRGETALLRAMSQLNKCVELLVEAGADVNVVVADDQIGSSLIKAAKVGHEKCVDIFINAGADVNFVDVFGNAPITESVENDNVECLKLLVKAGADVNTKNKTGEPLLLEASLKKSKCVDVLVEAGADVNVTDNSGYSPIIVTAGYGQYKHVESLIQAGADVNARIKAEGDKVRYIRLPPGTTALLAAAARSRRALNTFKVLLKSGAHMNIRTDPGYNALETRAEVRLNALETTFSGDYQDGGIPSEEVVSLLHAAGETTDGTAFYEFSIGDTTFRTEIEFPECLLKRQSTDTLKDICRAAIRKHLLDINPHFNLFIRMPQLGLPSRLANYLLYEEDLELTEGSVN